MGMIVTDEAELFSEEKRDTESSVRWLADGVPAFGLVNTGHGGRYVGSSDGWQDLKAHTVLTGRPYVR